MTIVCVDEQVRIKTPTVVCLGFFDGVHIGHQRLIERAKNVSRAQGLRVCVHTFAQMPVKVMRPSLAVKELTPLPEKAALLEKLGVDIVAVSNFDESMMHMRAADFFRDILIEKLCTKHIVAGFHHRFGFHGEANVEALSGLCQAAGVGLSVIPPITLENGELVSSTAIRRLLALGNTQKAEAMLGRPYIPPVQETDGMDITCGRKSR